MKLQKEISGPFFIQDGNLKHSQEFDLVFLLDGINTYEVIRVIDGGLLFYYDHFNRLTESLQRQGFNVRLNKEDIRNGLLLLVNKNSMVEGNIKIVYHRSDYTSLLFYPVVHSYPTREQYLHGVDTISLTEARPDPDIKNWRPLFKKRIKKLKEKNRVFEVILINHEGYITEGSQSNVFFIKKNEIFTASESMVLSGITRKYIFSICASLNIPIYESQISSSKLKDFDAVFISGTSPKILPVRKINETKFSPSNPLLRRLMSEFDNLIKQNTGI